MSKKCSGFAVSDRGQVARLLWGSWQHLMVGHMMLSSGPGHDDEEEEGTRVPESRSRTSFSTVWATGSNSGHQAWAPTEPSCWP